MHVYFGYLLITVSIFSYGYYAFFRKGEIKKREICGIIALVILGTGLIALDRLEKISGAGMELILGEAAKDADAIEEIREEVELVSSRMNLIEGEAKNRLNSIETTQQKVEETLVELLSVSSFAAIVLKAQNDDRHALEKLIVIVKDSNDQFQKQAEEVLMSVLLEFGGPITTFGYPWDEGDSIDQVPYGKLSNFYEGIPKGYRSELLNEIWGSKAYSKYQKIKFMIDVIQDTQSVRELWWACHHVDKEANLSPKNFLTYERYLKWWGENEEQYLGNSQA